MTDHSGGDDSSAWYSRRRYLQISAAVTAGLAGCNQSESDDTDSGPDTQADSGSDTTTATERQIEPRRDTAQPTPVPTEPPTPERMPGPSAWPAPGYDPGQTNWNEAVSVGPAPSLTNSLETGAEPSGSQWTGAYDGFYFVGESGRADRVIRASLTAAESEAITRQTSVPYTGVVAGPDGLLHAAGLGVTTYESATGDSRWRYETGSKQYLTPAGGTLFTTSSGGLLTALYALDGTVLWERTPASQFEAAPAVGSDAVYVCDIEGRLSAFDRRSGERRWQRQFTNDAAFVSPIAVDDLVIVALGNTVFAHEQASGDLRWRASLEGVRQISRSPSIFDGSVVVPGRNGTTKSLQLTDGSENWTTTETIYRTAVIAGDTVIGTGRATTSRTSIVGIDAATGEQRWDVPVDGAVWLLLASFGTLAALTFDGRLHLIE